jgi:hypothetical protein
MKASLCCSDYAIGQFQFLSRLLLIHGRYSYLRVSYTVNYFFYKNTVRAAGLVVCKWVFVTLLRTCLSSCHITYDSIVFLKQPPLFSLLLLHSSSNSSELHHACALLWRLGHVQRAGAIMNLIGRLRCVDTCDTAAL